MKKLFGFLLSLQIALVMLFSFQSPALAQWNRDGQRYDRYDRYERQMYREERMDRDYYYSDQEPSVSQIMQKANTFSSYAPAYKLGVDIILSILFIMFFSKFIMAVIDRMKAHPIKNGYVGFTFLIIFPLIALLFLGLIWLGIALFLGYGLLFLVSAFLAKIFIGWGIMNKLTHDYVLDWKAGIVGPVVVLILFYIQILGWIIIAVLLSMATGALVQEVLPLFKRQQLENHKAQK